MCLGRNAERRIKAGLEAPAEFGKVLLKAPFDLGARRIGGGNDNLGGDQQPLDLSHRFRQLDALSPGQRFQERTGKGIGSSIQLRALPPARSGEPDQADSCIGTARPDGNEVLPLK